MQPWHNNCVEVKLRENPDAPGLYDLFLDNENISHKVLKMTLELEGGCLPSLKLELCPEGLDINVLAKVQSVLVRNGQSLQVSGE